MGIIMLFNSQGFLLFFIVVYAFYLLLPHKKQNLLLLIASYFFYCCWDWRFSSLLILSSVVDYICARKIESSIDNSFRKGYLLLSIFVNLGVLFFFKYCNFFIFSLSRFLEGLGLEIDSHTLEIVLPVGISFYTFQTMSYTIDVYRKDVSAEKSFLSFALFVSFFPQLVAGPIEKASRLLPQINNKRTISWGLTADGLWLILYGCLLKVFCADNLSGPVDVAFSSSGTASPQTMFLAVIAFSFQILGDFAGYSFIAIGISKLMGFSLCTNFKYPYFVSNPSDFWKNWHISLSGWLRDYLYIPLGGNRSGVSRTCRNLIITMVLGGVWHGASLHFVLWGLYHGVLLVLYKFWAKRSLKALKHPLFALILMYLLTCIGWLIFRVESLLQLFQIMGHFFTKSWQGDEQSLVLLVHLIVFAFPILFVQFLLYRYNAGLSITAVPVRRRYALIAAMYIMILLLGEFKATEFIYFQF